MRCTMPVDAVLIAGPTASGKSALALALAEKLGGVDRQCRFDAGLSRSAHHHRAAVAGRRGARAASALRPCRCGGELFGRPLWLRRRRGAGSRRRATGRVPILVGGTGLYFKALTEGLAAVPPMPADIRAAVRARVADASGVAALHAELARARSRDGAAADGQRPLAHRPRAGGVRGHRAPAERLAPRRHAAAVDAASAAKIFLTCERKRTCRAHRDALCRHAAAGALEEVRALARAQARPAAAGDEGAWRALADPASRRRDLAG